jgi:Ca-activated chloride channel family protein
MNSLAGALILALIGLPCAAQGPYTLRLGVRVVSVDVTVLDDKDNLVNGLTKDDFVVYENGVPQEIRFFSPVSTPQFVFLLFDSSGSTRNNRDFMRSAFTRLVENLRPQDRLAMASFDDDITWHLNWSTDRTRALAALEEVMRPHESNGTRFYAALDRTLRRQFKGVVGRRAVVVLTDGQDTSFVYQSQRDLKTVLQSSREQRIPVHIVVLKSELDSQFILPNTRSYIDAVHANMHRIVDNSGGEILFSRDLEDIAPFYEQIGRRLGTSYSFGYVPSNSQSDGSFRKIEVKARNSTFHLTHTPASYYALPQGQ